MKRGRRTWRVEMYMRGGTDYRKPSAPKEEAAAPIQETTTDVEKRKKLREAWDRILKSIGLLGICLVLFVVALFAQKIGWEHWPGARLVKDAIWIGIFIAVACLGKVFFMSKQ